MADLRGDIAAFIRRPWFWCRDKQLPRILVTGCDAIEVAEEMAAPFTDYLPTALVRESGHGSVPALVAALAGPQGQLGKPVGGSFLPAPRFPLAQFVLWAREQKATPVPEVKNWPPDPQSHEGFQTFKERLNDWRRKTSGEGGRWRLAADFFIGRAALTWVPLGTLVSWLAAGPSDLVGVLPWLLGLLVALAGIIAQGLGSIRGSFFYGWFRRQPFVRRKRWERLAWYALRLANATDDDIEKLLVHALCEDLRQAYQKWPIPWPSWGRGLYCLLRIEVNDVKGVNARFLRLLEDTCEETGLPVPMVVLAAVPDELAGPWTSARTAELGGLRGNVRKWRSEQLRRRAPLRLVVRAGEHGSPPDPPYRLKPWRHQARAFGYWGVVLLVVPGLVVWFAVNNLSDRAAHCGGLAYVERIGDECVGVVNAPEAAPADLFARQIDALVKKIDKNNAYAVESGRYVSLVLFGEYSIKKLSDDDSRFASAVSELTAAEEYQRDISSTPRLRILIANAGDDYRQGRRAAELISELAGRDPHVVGVVGLARSVEGVEQAVRQFDTAKIPAVATTATADHLGIIDRNPSPYYFHVSPTNFREATLAARFAHRTLLAQEETASAVIVQDGTREDIYTSNLAEDFATALRTEHITVGPPVPYGASRDGMSTAVAKACERDADIFMYAGRAPEFVDFLRALEGSSECGAGVLKVLAGDDVIKVVADHSVEIAAMKQVEVHYAALASREMWRGIAHPTGFISGLLAGRHANVVDDSLILTYDALDVIYRAADKAYRPGDQLPSRGDVLYRLSKTSDESAWGGSGGVIDFGGKERHDPMDKAISIMKVEGGSSVSMIRCGAMDASERSPNDPRCAHLPDAPENTP